MERMTDRLAPIVQTVAHKGFAVVRDPEMRAVLEEAGLADWDRFARSWDDLVVDAYMADGGRYRRRRFACFRASPEGIARKPHQPHYQSRDYNPVNGGIQRWFDPVTQEIGAHPAMRHGTRTTLGTSTDAFVYKMTTSSDTVYVALDRGDAATNAPNLPAGTYDDLINGGTVTTPLSIPPRTGMVLRAH